MGRGNYYNQEGMQFYVVYPEEQDEMDLMFEDLQSLIYCLAEKKGFWRCNEWTRNDLHYIVENDLMKIGFADNQNSVAVCFSPRVTQKELFDKRTIPLIKYFLNGIMTEYDVSGRCGAWTSAEISNVEEAIERFCDFDRPAYG